MALQVQIGDTIRSYDFKPMVGRYDCYVEGVVEAINDSSQGYDAYRIRVTTDYRGGEDLNFIGEGSRMAQTVFVPHRVSFMEYDGRVMNLSR